jgi:hypothetical protein
MAAPILCYVCKTAMSESVDLSGLLNYFRPVHANDNKHGKLKHMSLQ